MADMVFVSRSGELQQGVLDSYSNLPILPHVDSQEWRVKRRGQVDVISIVRHYMRFAYTMKQKHDMIITALGPRGEGGGQ
jgi:hypothetical protein